MEADSDICRLLMVESLIIPKKPRSKLSKTTKSEDKIDNVHRCNCCRSFEQPDLFNSPPKNSKPDLYADMNSGGMDWPESGSSDEEEKEFPGEEYKLKYPKLYDLAMKIKSGRDFDAKLMRERKEITAKYNQLAEATQGFYTGDLPIMWFLWKKIEIFEWCGEERDRFADFALQCHGLKLKRIIRSNWKPMEEGIEGYLTMEACDGKYYEAIVSRNEDCEKELKLFREAVFYPDIGDNLQHLAKHVVDSCIAEWA